MTPRQFGRNAPKGWFVGLGIALIGALPAYISLDVALRYHDLFEDDPSLVTFIAITGAIAIAFFGVAGWLALASKRIGLELEVGPDGVGFANTRFFAPTRTAHVRWAEVERVVFEHAPRVGESIRFQARGGGTPWHGRHLPLQLCETAFDELLPVLERSAGAAGFRLRRSSALTLLVYDRHVYAVEPAG